MNERALQQILGTDKRNPNFTIYRCAEDQCLHVYYGAELFEKVPDDRNDAQYKLLVARLYNAKINATRIKEVFDVDFKTMRRWGEALHRGDPNQLVRVLSGREAQRKFTIEIQSFARLRFQQIYPRNRSSYSQQIRREIYEVFGEKLSAETIRPFFGKLRTSYNEKKETSCESMYCARKEQKPPIPIEPAEDSPNRKSSPTFEMLSNRWAHFVHHAGVLLFAQILLRVGQLGAKDGWLLKQWLATVLLGAVNIEQTKLLDFKALGLLVGRTLKSRRPQRVQLGQLAASGVAPSLYRLNASQTNLNTCNDFYYDPHTKHYTGNLKLLKGWCANKHFADKALHMDFIHTAQGHPVYVSYTDNYEDLRERLDQTVMNLRSDLHMDRHQTLSLILDRGIYSMAVFERICAQEALHIITWAKDYKSDSWEEENVAGRFIMQRARNHSQDIQLYGFEYIDTLWEKNEALRLLRVRATNPKNKTIELGVLSDDLERPAEESLRLIFRRWVQENDFKYLEKHYGINQITSYASVSYAQLKNELEDRQIKSGEYKALMQERSTLRVQLKRELLNEHHHPAKSTKRTARINELSLQEKELTDQIAQTQKEESRLETLIRGCYHRLDNASKQVMDSLKLIARNAFYNLLEPFKQEYDNYRDDHVIFRNLTHAHGLLVEDEQAVRIILYPTAHYPPVLRNTVIRLLEKINATHPTMPDGSSRKLSFALGDKMGIELANSNP